MYFNFDKKEILDQVNISKFTGWNELQVCKLEMKKDQNLNSEQINLYFPKIALKEKIFIVVKGKVTINILQKKYTLSEFDALNLASNKEKILFTCYENAEIYMISANNPEVYTDAPFFFNFKKDLETRDLWGGQCISRPYEGKGLTVVMFDLKKGFKFYDKGHENEQITWLIDGSMEFHTNNVKTILKKNCGVDIGSKHVHGGVSNGALGFDAFFPKREEKRYKKEN
jgi:quercetin dioxygenase-like cupin family protein